jgi:acyl-CoA synthetase (AMP-forming)/AMP-acid ligase II
MWKNEDDCQTVTLDQFIALAKAHAANFFSHNLGTGDTVVLIMPQGIPLMAAFAGAMLLGAALPMLYMN